MIRAIGLHGGQFGDLIMGTVAARSFKEIHPDSHFTLAVGPQFRDILPLFHNQPGYDSTHVWSTYDGWPEKKDLNYLAAAHYDFVFHPFPQHRVQNWWEYRHQYAETAHMCGLPVPTDIQPRLKQWFSLNPQLKGEKVVAFAPFGGSGGVNDKALSVLQAQAIVDWLSERGWGVLHLGGENEPRLNGAKWLSTNYFDSVRNMLSCRALIHCDTGLGHVAGAYNHPSLGIYSTHYFTEKWVDQIKPTHSNFLSVQATTIPEINLDILFKNLTLLLS